MVLPDGISLRFSRLTGVLGIADFAWYTAGNATSLVGYWMSRLAVGWLAWELTRSEIWLGVVAFAEFGPSVAITTLGGIMADRHDRMRLLLGSQIASAVLTVLLAVLHVTGWLNIWLLVAITAVLGLIAGFNLPARLAVAPSLVDRERLPAAVAVNAISFNSARFVGPMLAAPLLVWTGATTIFALNALTFLFFAYCLARVRHAPDAGTAGAQAGGGFLDAVGGVLRDPLLAAMLALQLSVGLMIRPAAELFPAFADAVFGRGPAGLAWLNAALGVGAILGALWSSGQSGPALLGRGIWLWAVLFAVTLAVFALTPLFWPAVALLVLHGIAMAGCGIGSLAYVQLRCPREKLGRILSLYGVIFRAAPAVGALGIGLLAEWIGLAEAALVAAALGLLLIGLTAPALLRRDAAGAAERLNSARRPQLG